MEYLEFRPDARLAKYVECYWYAFSRKPPFQDRESLIPDGTIECMFNFGDEYNQIVGDVREAVKGAHVIGIRKEALTISQTGRQHFFCIRFKPGGTFPFFGIPAHLFANGFYGMSDLFGKEVNELEDRLYHATDNAARVAITDGFLLREISGRCLPISMLPIRPWNEDSTGSWA